MDEARAVMRRLDRIEVLDRERADPRTLIAELRELVREAEDWARAEGDERAETAFEVCKEAMADDVVHA
jgi:hypothetical protein